MLVIVKMISAANSFQFQGFPTVRRCAIIRSDVVCLVTKINCGVRPPESPNRVKYIGCSSRERTSADVRLK